MSKKSFLGVAIALALAAGPALAAERCVDDACHARLLFAEAEPGGSVTATDATRYGAWGFDVAGMDTTVKPGADFFEYVNGRWAKATPIPADQSSYGSFRVLRDLSEARVRALLESYPQGDTASGGDLVIGRTVEGYGVLCRLTSELTGTHRQGAARRKLTSTPPRRPAGACPCRTTCYAAP